MEHQCLRIYVREGMRRGGQRIHDWLFEHAQAVGIGGGTVFRASADFGRHGRHEDEFFELAGQLTETVEFIGTPAQIEQLLDTLGRAGLRLAFSTYPVHFGVTGGQEAS